MNAHEVFQIMNVKPELIRQFRAMTELEQFQLSYIDPLTGLYNRRAFDTDEREWVLLLDLDSFKWINDTFGHGTGDVTLTEFSDLLAETFGRNNCYRIGGDEFAVKFSRPGFKPLLVDDLRQTFPGISFGLADSVTEADRELYKNKKEREASGERAETAGEPPWANLYLNKHQPLPHHRRENRDYG